LYLGGSPSVPDNSNGREIARMREEIDQKVPHRRLPTL
jgi:hypothetical protein